jgi:hypothetical protein
VRAGRGSEHERDHRAPAARERGAELAPVRRVLLLRPDRHLARGHGRERPRWRASAHAHAAGAGGGERARAHAPAQLPESAATVSHPSASKR